MQIETKVQDGRVDFDFLMGNWKGHNRRLRARLKGSTDWEEFECDLTVHKILNGLGNFDEVIFYRASGTTYGATLRLFDPETQLWRIYWADGVHGILDVPMIGAFKNGRGEFYAQEMFEGQPIFRVSSGHIRAMALVAGNRPFRLMVARPGKLTGPATLRQPNSWSIAKA